MARNGVYQPPQPLHEMASINPEMALGLEEWVSGLPHPLDAGRERDPATRIRNWYIQARSHPLWQIFLREADEDEGFYVGGDYQWSKYGSLEALRRLEAAKKAHVSLNYIQSTVDVLVGFERQNRYDHKASPEGSEDAEGARIFSWLMKHASTRARFPERESEVFQYGLIRGADVAEIAVDWSENPFEGKIKLDTWRAGREVIWDPHWREADYTDARYFLKLRWAWIEDILRLYPDKEREIWAGTSVLDAMFHPFLATTDGPRGDAYGSTTDHPYETLSVETLFYSPHDRRILVIEGWWRESETVWMVAHRLTGRQEAVSSEQDARLVASSDPENWGVIQKQIRTIKTATVLPATRTILDGPHKSPYTNDPGHYPFVPYIAKRLGNHMYGIVRNMKDPQLVENKRISQLLDILARWANFRPLVPKNSLEDPRSVEDHLSTAAIVYNPAGGGKPDWYVPQGLTEIARGLLEVAGQMKMALREITGINTDLLGLKGDDSSGIAIARRQAQGQVISTVYFDNFKLFRGLVADRLGRRIQQVMTTEKILRIIDPENGQWVRVILNPHEAEMLSPEQFTQWVEQQRDETGRPYVLRSVEALRYDLTMTEAPLTPSARATALLALLEIARAVPDYIAALAPSIVELSEIPNRHQILDSIRQINQLRGIGGGQPPSPEDPAATAGAPGITPPVQPPGMPRSPAAAAPVPVGSGRRPSAQVRRTLMASTGGAPIGAGP